MEYVVVTLSSPYLKAKHSSKTEEYTKDLLFPLDTPQYILVETLIDAFNIDINKNKLRGFLGTRHKKTLRDVGVKYGDFLVLDFEEILAKASLVCVDGPEFDLMREDVIIGCHPDADIDLRSVPNQEFVSRRHAKIICRDDKYYIMALDSLNGTYVDGEEVLQGKKVLLKVAFSNEEDLAQKASIIRLGASGKESIKVFVKKRRK